MSPPWRDKCFLLFFFQISMQNFNISKMYAGLSMNPTLPPNRLCRMTLNFPFWPPKTVKQTFLILLTKGTMADPYSENSRENPACVPPHFPLSLAQVTKPILSDLNTNIKQTYFKNHVPIFSLFHINHMIQHDLHCSQRHFFF